MNGYDLAFALIQMVGIEMTREQLQAKLEAEQAKGTSEVELVKLVQGWREEARIAALSAKPE